MSRILIVEDERAIRSLIEAFLTIRADNTVDAVDSAEAALDIFEPGKYSLVIIDIALVAMNGLELSLNIRERDKNVFIVGITGYYNALFKDYDGTLAGFNDIFEKPFGYKDFLRLLKTRGYL